MLIYCRESKFPQSMDISHPTLFSLGHKSRLKYKIIRKYKRRSNKHSFKLLEVNQIKIA